jgi:hypothetical protein
MLERACRFYREAITLPPNQGTVMGAPNWTPAVKRFIPLLSVIAVTLALSAFAQAEPKLEMHRVGVKTDDGSGWNTAISTDGSFAVLMPIPFNDFTTRDAATGDTTYVIGAKSTEGIKFVAVEIKPNGKPLPDLASIPQGFAATAGNKVSDVTRRSEDGADVLSLMVVNAKVTLYMRCIQLRGGRYVMSIELPNAHRELVAEFKDRFFESFKLKTKS